VIGNTFKTLQLYLSHSDESIAATCTLLLPFPENLKPNE